MSYASLAELGDKDPAMLRLNQSIKSADAKAHVVVLFIQPTTASVLFNHLNCSFPPGTFQFVWADGVRFWPSASGHEEYNELLNGTIATEMNARQLKFIDKSWDASTLLNIDCNAQLCVSPFYRQLVEERLKCTVPADCGNCTSRHRMHPLQLNSSRPICTPDQLNTTGNLTQQYIQSQLREASLMFDAVKVVVEAILELHARVCGANEHGMCAEMFDRTKADDMFDVIYEQAVNRE